LARSIKEYFYGNDMAVGRLAVLTALQTGKLEQT